MADAIQLASALTSLIGATCVVVDYAKKLYDSQKSAQELYERVRDLQHLLENIQPVVVSIEAPSRQAVLNDQNRRLKAGIKGCLEGCERSVKEINHRLKGFADGKRGSLKARIGYVYSEREIKAHRATIEGHIQSLQLSLIALNGLNDSVNHATTHEFLQQLLQLFAYLIVTQQQHQPRPANMGIRTHGSATSTLLSNDTAHTRLLPAIEHPEQNLEIYFNPIPWSRNEPLPVLAENPRLQPQHTSRIEELSTDDLSSDNFVDEPVIDSPLAIAVKHNQPAIVRTLIEGGQDIKAADTEGWTLIHHAVSHKAFDALLVLLQSAQSKSPELIDAQNLKQHTALMLCARKAEHGSSLELARVLIEHGADVNLEDSNGKTALYMLTEFVAKGHRIDFAELLVSNGATFGPKSPHRPTRAKDYYDLLPDMAEQVRRSSSVASGGLTADLYGTSPGSPASSAGEDGKAKPRGFSFSSLKRRFSSNSEHNGL